MKEGQAQSLFDQISEAVSAALPSGLTEDVRRNLKATLRSTLNKMDLVTREELEIQEMVLQRTRAKLESLEEQLKELEQRLSDKR